MAEELAQDEGNAGTAGDDWMRPVLCDEALRLGRLLAGLSRLGRRGAARQELLRAAGLTRNERERILLTGRAAACDDLAPSREVVPLPPSPEE